MKPLGLRERVGQLRRAHPFFRIGVPLLSVLYLSAIKALGGLGPEHLALVLLALGFAFWSDGSRRIARIAYPFLLWALFAGESVASGPERNYRVKPGDTLWSIAVRTSAGDPREGVWKLRERNRLDSAIPQSSDFSIDAIEHIGDGDQDTRTDG